MTISERTSWCAALAATALVLLVGCGGSSAAPEASAPKGTMILATTTSTRDTGLLDVLTPRFEKAVSCRVKTLATGSGEALKLGERGDADVLLVHSPAAEAAYMGAGGGRTRKAVMHNDFVLVGPASDPAHIAAASDAADALSRIAAAKAPFASRDDDSGTNAKELELWAASGTKPAGAWYLRTGQGMGQTLTIANQKRAYTLSDRGTYLATANTDLKLLHQGGADLRNNYHVIVVKHAGTNVGCARAFSTWIISRPVQKTIATFGVAKYGQALFTPDAKH
jgi:tungstate transport system substrate-binding protein